MLKSKQAVLRILIVPVQDLSLGLPIEQVQKVIPTPTIFKGGVPTLGITHFESEEVIVIDLHQKIYGQRNQKSEPYVVLIKAAEQLYGILTISLPVIQEVKASQVNPLSQEYRDRDPLGIASHTAVVQRGEETQTVFLVNAADLIKVS